jgi:hypothetical protein
MSVFSKIPKGLTVLATAAALVAGVAYAQTSTNTDPAQPSANKTGQPGAALGNGTGSGTSSGMNSGSTMNNTATPATSTDSGMNNSAQSDIVSPQPRADRN